MVHWLASQSDGGCYSIHNTQCQCGSHPQDNHQHSWGDICIKTKINPRCQEVTFLRLGCVNLNLLLFLKVFWKRQSPEKVSIIFFWRLQKCFSISTSLLSDKFDRIQLEFVGTRKVVFVLLRFLGEEISNPLVDWQLSSSFYRTGRAAAVVDYSRWCLATIFVHSQAIRWYSDIYSDIVI